MGELTRRGVSALGPGDVSRITVRIAGDEYPLRGEGDTEYLRALAAKVDARLRALAKANPQMGLSRIAVLCTLNLADELTRLEEQYQRVLSLLEREWDRRRQEMEAVAVPVPVPPQPPAS